MSSLSLNKPRLIDPLGMNIHVTLSVVFNKRWTSSSNFKAVTWNHETSLLLFYLEDLNLNTIFILTLRVTAIREVLCEIKSKEALCFWVFTLYKIQNHPKGGIFTWWWSIKKKGIKVFGEAVFSIHICYLILILRTNNKKIPLVNNCCTYSLLNNFMFPICCLNDCMSTIARLGKCCIGK